jgi:phosphoglycolate phosphatase-like HAD superfamily hydrolase
MLHEAPARSMPAIVCDLDNTLFDWVHAWAVSFEAMLQEIDATVDRSVLLRAIKQIHVARQTTEVWNLLSLLPEQDRCADAFTRGAEAYRRTYAETLCLYPGVRSTLATLRTRGFKIIGYTESASMLSQARVCTLGLDAFIDTLYVAADHPEMAATPMPLWPGEPLPCRVTEVRQLPPDLLKPDPRALLTILVECDIAPGNAIYVGDHLKKDIGMAMRAGVPAVWARYGTVRMRHELELLNQVCHWPIEPFEIADVSPLPMHTIGAFDELLAAVPEEMPEVAVTRGRRVRFGSRLASTYAADE